MAAVPLLNRRYQVERRLGGGASAEVFLVRDRRTGDAPRALKLLRTLDGDACTRFTAEFRRLAALDHPRLIRVFDLERVDQAVPGLASGGLFFTADHADGVDAAAAVAAATDPVEVLLVIAEDVAAALAHVHAAGLVHCDVKPDNVVVGSAGGAMAATLLDLGLSAARGASGGARGTLAYMSAEALAGAPEARSDIYALGATLYHAACGSAPAAGSDAHAVARAVVDGQHVPLAERAPWVPAPLAEVIERMLAVAPEQRPSTAAVVQSEMARVREALDLPRRDRAPRGASSTLLPPRLVDRDDAVAAVVDAFADPAVRVVRLVGPDGAGRHAVARAAVRHHQLAVAAGRAAAIDVVWGDPDRVATVLAERAGAGGDSSAGEAGDDARARARFADALLARAAAVDDARRLIIVLDAAADDERAVAVERAVIAAAPSLLLIRFTTAAAELPGGRNVDVTPLDDRATAALASSMLGRPVAARWAAELTRATAGLPRLIVEAVRAAAVGDGDPEAISPASLVDATRGADQALADLLVRRAGALPPERAAVIESLAVLGGAAAVDAVAAVLESDPATVERAAAPLIGNGLVIAQGDQLSLPSPAHARVLHRAIPTARRVALHRLAAAWHQQHGDVPALARHLLETGPAARAVAACREAAPILARRGSPAAARALLERAADKVSGAAAAELALELAALSIAVGDYPAAVAQAEKAVRSRAHAIRRRARLLLARAQQKSGDLDGAEKVLASMHADAPGDGEVAGTYARLLVSRGRYADAGEVAGEPPAADDLEDGAAIRLESAGLAALYSGDQAAAASAFAELERRAQRAGDRALAGRALGLAGLAAHARGDIATAATLYERAAADARAAADVHAAAVYELNRASAHAERGRHGAALEALDAGLASLQRLGDVPELAAALYNRGVELLMVGEVDAAARAADRALQTARAHGTPQMQLYARLLQGDVARRTGDRAAAIAAYRDALAAAGGDGPNARERLVAAINLGEVLAESGDRAGLDALDDAADDARSADDRDRLAVTRARALLALGMDPQPIAGDLDEARRRTRATGRIDQAWRADVVAARVARAGGDDTRARALADEARALYDQLVADTPEVRRAGLARDPDARALAALGAELSGQVARSRAGAARAEAGVERDLRRLLTLSRRLNSELRLEPLLDQVIDTVIELTSAERGFLLLGDAGGALAITVARNFEQTALAGEELGLSRSIAERAATTGEVVLTVDAAFDERFGAAESVAAMRLRSVLAVPLRQKDRIIGTIYVDHRFRSGAFDDAAIELTRELADIAAVAIDNARLAEDNQRRQREIAELNRRLEAEVVEKETELATVRARLPADAGNLRHDYDAIVGRSPAMLELLRLLDRAADTVLPVVIHGESGTGKELVARALHDNGPRRGGPFVAVNCGAMPETLLESELFGHVRGAFTGADRDRPGLFEVASGGTLLLDEIADTSLAMQSKLLRVLQEGEIRRVGDSRTRPVDVRIVAATNRPLEQLVASGELREDLFYRLSVIRVDVPPLRERLEDLPALAEHILVRVAGDGETPRLTRAALARLAAHDWPGNVRELENEMARAAALAGEVIDVADLSPRIASATPSAPDSGAGRQPGAQAAGRDPGAGAGGRGDEPHQRQPDRRRQAARPQSLRPAEEAQALRPGRRTRLTRAGVSGAAGDHAQQRAAGVLADVVVGVTVGEELEEVAGLVAAQRRGGVDGQADELRIAHVGGVGDRLDRARLAEALQRADGGRANRPRRVAEQRNDVVGERRQLALARHLQRPDAQIVVRLAAVDGRGQGRAHVVERSGADPLLVAQPAGGQRQRQPQLLDQGAGHVGALGQGSHQVDVVVGRQVLTAVAPDHARLDHRVDVGALARRCRRQHVRDAQLDPGAAAVHAGGHLVVGADERSGGDQQRAELLAQQRLGGVPALGLALLGLDPRRHVDHHDPLRRRCGRGGIVGPRRLYGLLVRVLLAPRSRGQHRDGRRPCCSHSRL